MKTPALNYIAALFKIQVFLFVFSFSLSKAQNNSELGLLEQKTSSYNYEQLKKSDHKRGYNLSYNPFKFVGNSLLWVYQNIFSEQIMSDCGFEPSCSAFAKQALKERGFLLGIFLAADRLTRCNGSAQIESEPYLVNKKTGKLRDEPQMYKISK